MNNSQEQGWQEVLDSKDFEEEILALIRFVRSTVIVEGGGDEDYIDLTIGMDEDGSWGYQTGDNSFTGGAYGYAHWAVVGIYQDTEPESVLQEIVEQLEDLLTHY